MKYILRYINISVIHHNKTYLLIYIEVIMAKHPNIMFRRLVVDIRNKKKKKKLYSVQKQRKIHWREYNLSKINDIKSILSFIRKSVDEVFIDEDFFKVGRPSVNPKNLVKAIFILRSCGNSRKTGSGLA